MGRRGSHTTARELETCTFQGPCASKNTKIPREDPQRDTKRAKRWREKEEKARNFGPPTLRGPTLRGRFGQSRPIKVGQSRFCQSRSIKVGQSRSNYSGQSRFGQSRNRPKSANKDGQSRFGQSRSQPCVSQGVAGVCGRVCVCGTGCLLQGCVSQETLKPKNLKT